MSLYYDLPVYRDVYSLILKIFKFTKEFSREYKYTLEQDLKKDSIVLVRSIYRAVQAVVVIWCRLTFKDHVSFRYTINFIYNKLLAECRHKIYTDII
jgi:hypothetical protein